MIYLRQSTASQSVLIGPFVDSTDGVTAETGLTIANTDIRLSANGGNMFAKTSGGGTHDEIGYYTITLDATDTATVGRLQLACAVSGALPVYHEFQVLEEAVFDNLFAASAVGPLAANSDGSVLTEAGGTGDHLTAINLPNQTMDIVGNITGNVSGSVGSVTGNVGGITGTITTFDALYTAQGSQHAQTQSDIAGLNDVAATDIVSGGAITTSSGVANANLEQISASAITESSSGRIAGNFNTFFDNGDSASAQTQDDVGGGSSLTVADIADGVWDEATSGHVGAGSFGQLAANVLEDTGTTLPAAHTQTQSDIAGLNDPTAADIRAEIDSNSTQLAAIVADSNELQTDWANGGRLDLILDARASQSSVDTIDGIVDDILLDTAEIGAAGAGLTEAGGTGDHLTAVPWNAAWDAEVQSEVADALAVYDPPTRAEATTDVNSVLTILGTPADTDIATDIANLDSDVAGLNDVSQAEVNAQVVDALNVDTYAEPGAGAPAATASLVAKIGYLYKAWRNRTTQTATTTTLYNDDATTAAQVVTVSDDSTTFDKGEVGSA